MLREEDPDEFSYSKGVFCPCHICPVKFLRWTIVVSTTNGNQGRKFAKCTKIHPGGAECGRWFWKDNEDEIAEHLYSSKYYSSPFRMPSGTSRSHTRATASTQLDSKLRCGFVGAGMPCGWTPNSRCIEQHCRSHCSGNGCPVPDHKKHEDVAQLQSPASSVVPPIPPPIPSSSSAPVISTAKPASSHSRRSPAIAPDASSSSRCNSTAKPASSHSRRSPAIAPDASRLAKSSILIFAYISEITPMPREVQGSLKDGNLLVDCSMLDTIELPSDNGRFCYYSSSLRGWVQGSIPHGLKVESGLKMNGSPVVLLSSVKGSQIAKVDDLLARLKSANSSELLMNPSNLGNRRSAMQAKLHDIQKLALDETRTKLKPPKPNPSNPTKRNKHSTQSPSTPSPNPRKKPRHHNHTTSVIYISSDSPSPHSSPDGTVISIPSPPPPRVKSKSSKRRPVSVHPKQEPQSSPEPNPQPKPSKGLKKLLSEHERGHSRSRSLSRPNSSHHHSMSHQHSRSQSHHSRTHQRSMLHQHSRHFSQSRSRSRHSSHSRSRSRHHSSRSSHRSSHQLSPSRSHSRSCRHNSLTPEPLPSQRHKGKGKARARPEPTSPTPEPPQKAKRDSEIENPEDWPKSYYAIDIAALIATKERPRQAYFERKFPGVRWRQSTFDDQRKRWRNAPASTCHRYLKYGRTRGGLWRNFMRDVPMPDAELKAVKKFYSRQVKKEMSGEGSSDERRRSRRYASTDSEEEPEVEGGEEVVVKAEVEDKEEEGEEEMGEEEEELDELKDDDKVEADGEELEAGPSQHRPRANATRSSKFVIVDSDGEAS